MLIQRRCILAQLRSVTTYEIELIILKPYAAKAEVSTYYSRALFDSKGTTFVNHSLLYSKRPKNHEGQTRIF
jgi:hypothetical protein